MDEIERLFKEKEDLEKALAHKIKKEELKKEIRALKGKLNPTTKIFNSFVNIFEPKKK